MTHTHDGREKITIEGRSNEPVITIRGTYDDDEHFGDLTYVLEGAELLTAPDGKFRIEAKHDNGTDFEHDSAKVAVFEGVGLSPAHSYATYFGFEGTIVKAYHYPAGQTFEPGTEMPHSQDDPEIRICDSDYYHPEGGGWEKGHLLMPFYPPRIQNFPVLMGARIEIDFSRFLDRAEEAPKIAHRGVAHKFNALADWHEQAGTKLPPHEMRALAAEYTALAGDDKAEEDES